jgi:cell division protein FtsL
MKKALQISVLVVLLAVTIVFGFSESDNMMYFWISKVIAIVAGYILYILTNKWSVDLGIDKIDNEA